MFSQQSRFSHKMVVPRKSLIVARLDHVQSICLHWNYCYWMSLYCALLPFFWIIYFLCVKLYQTNWYSQVILTMILVACLVFYMLKLLCWLKSLSCKLHCLAVPGNSRKTCMLLKSLHSHRNLTKNETIFIPIICTVMFTSAERCVHLPT